MPRLASQAVATGGSVTVPCKGRKRVTFIVSQGGSSVTACDYVISAQADNASDAGAARAFVSDASTGSNMQGSLAVSSANGGVLTVDDVAELAQLRITLSNYTGVGNPHVVAMGD